MTHVSSVGSAALLILQQTTAATQPGQGEAGSSDIVAVANGVSAKVGSARQPGRDLARITEAMFSVNSVDITKLKLELIERTGKALGVNQADYVSKDEFVDAMQTALSDLRREGGDLAVMGLEKKLGLDSLGLTIEDVIASARNPTSHDKLTKALEKKAGKTAEDLQLEKTPQNAYAVPDSFGVYGPSR